MKSSMHPKPDVFSTARPGCMASTTARQVKRLVCSFACVCAAPACVLEHVLIKGTALTTQRQPYCRGTRVDKRVGVTAPAPGDTALCPADRAPSTCSESCLHKASHASFRHAQRNLYRTELDTKVRGGVMCVKAANEVQRVADLVRDGRVARERGKGRPKSLDMRDPCTQLT
jgi:hypothetical protein